MTDTAPTKKIIITYVSAGSGHLRAAEALYDYFKRNCAPGHQIKIVDVLDLTNPFFRISYSYGYSFLINHSLWLWGFSFWITSLKCLHPVNEFLTFILHSTNAKRFIKFLAAEKPDYIISTHFLPSQIASRMKKIGKINAKLVSVITDFGVHPYWVSEKIDLYAVASDLTRKKLIHEGIPEENIKVLGIPVESKFSNLYDKKTLCEKLDILAHKFTVLIATGSFGIGPIEEIVDLLHKDAQILVVCAKNRRLLTRLKRKGYTDVKIFGYVDNIQELMAVSDIIITKPGGLTISEALIMELAPIFISPIPGQEAENTHVMSYYNISGAAKGAQDIRRIVLDYAGHPDKLSRVKRNIKKIKKPDAARELCDVIC